MRVCWGVDERTIDFGDDVSGLIPASAAGSRSKTSVDQHAFVFVDAEFAGQIERQWLQADSNQARTTLPLLIS